MKKIPTSCLISVPLYFSHHIMLKKNEKVSWGGPWECTNMEKVTKSVFTTTWHVVTEDKGLWWTLSSFLIIDIIELKPSDNISIVRSCGGVEGLPMSTQKWPKWAKMPSIGKRGKNGKKMMKKIKLFPISCSKSMHLYFIHHIMPEKKKKMPWGGSWECTNMGKAIFPF